MVRFALAALLVIVSVGAACAQDPALAPLGEDELPPEMLEDLPLPEVPLQASDPASAYLGAEYVLWWLREGRVPPVLTTSPPASAGVPGMPGTTVLYGGNRLMTRHDDRFNGVRLTLGYWFTPDLGIEARGVALERDSTHFKQTSNGSKVLALPFTNAVTGLPGSTIIASPGVSSGGFVGYSRIEFFTEEVNCIRPLTVSPQFRLDLLAGARFAQMRDRTDLTSAGTLLPGGSTIFGIEDHYGTHNYFYGGQVGLRSEVTRGRMFINFRGEAALGGNDEAVYTKGQRITATPVSRTVTPIGMYVLPSNTGTFSRMAFNSIYEFDFNVGFRISTRSRIFMGYTLFLWDSPLRAGDQVSTVVNTSQITGPLVGPALPSIPFKSDLFWAQGINVGLEMRW